MRIDVHSHIIPAVFVSPEGIRIPEYGTSDIYAMPNVASVFQTATGAATTFGLIAPAGQGLQGDMHSVDARLRHMDEQGIDMHVLSMPPIYFYSLPPEQALRVTQSVNNALAGIVAGHPDRFIAIADLPVQAPELAARELERCVKELGLRGLEMCTNILGRNLDDKALAPLWAKMQELDVPAFLHPSNVLGADRLGSYHLGNLIGNPTDTAVAAASLIFGGVLREFPRIKFYLAHGGGTCPYLRGRWEHGWRVRAEGKVTITKPPSTYFGQLMFDTLTHSGPALNYLVETCGADHVMLGTDYPFDMADPDPVKHVASLPHASNADKDLMLGGNAMQLFKIGT